MTKIVFLPPFEIHEDAININLLNFIPNKYYT